jgi:hypothetical protein
MRDDTSTLGVPLVVAGAPEWRTLDEAAWRQELASARLDSGRLQISAPTDQLGAIVNRVGAPYVDLLPPFQQAAANGGGPYYLDGDKHWTASGHAVAAGALADALHHLGLDGH